MKSRARRRLLVTTALTLVGAVATACTGTADDPAASTGPDASATSPSVQPVPSVTQNGPSAGSQSTSPTRPPPASTPVPQPSQGDVSSTPSPPPPVETRRPVPLDSPAASGGLRAEVSQVKAINAKATGPGEISGPAVAVTVTVRNQSARRADLSAALVTLQDADGAPGGDILGPPARPFSGRLAPGKSSKGVYVFTVSRDQLEPITVRVNLGSELPELVFRGNAT